jgi:hypothetical protein
MGIWAYAAGKVRSVLYIGIGFGFFALSHLFTLIGLAASLSILLLILRLLGYLLVIYAIYIVIAKKKNA